jgi:hypothetical protein
MGKELSIVYMQDAMGCAHAPDTREAVWQDTTCLSLARVLGSVHLETTSLNFVQTLMGQVEAVTQKTKPSGDRICETRKSITTPFQHAQHQDCKTLDHLRLQCLF